MIRLESRALAPLYVTLFSLTFSLSLSACQPPITHSSPTTTASSATSTSASNAPANASSQLPDNPETTSLQFRIEGDSGLQAFVLQQSNGVCLNDLKRIETRFTLAQSPSPQWQQQLQDQGIVVNDKELTLRSELANLSTLITGITFNLSHLPPGETAGSISLLDSQNQSLGQIQFKLALSSAAHQASVLLKSLEAVPHQAGCPILSADLTGASLISLSGGLMLEVNSNSSPTPMPTPNLPISTPSPVSSSPNPLPPPVPAPRNPQIAARSIDTLTLLWDFAELPVAHAYRVYLDGNLISNNLSSKYYTFTNLKASSAYTLAVETIFNGQISQLVEIQASTTAGGKEGIGNFAGGGGSNPAPTATPVTAEAPILSKLSKGIGAVDSQLTLTGSRFSSTPSQNTVKFGETIANVISASPSELLVSVPARNNGPTQVTVSTAGQSSAALNFNLVSEGLISNLLNNGIQEDPDIASDHNGNSIVVWKSTPIQGNATIHAQRYDAFGNLIGAEFQANNLTTDQQSKPSVAMDSDGDFVVAWQSFENNQNHIFTQRFNPDAIAQGSAIKINTAAITNTATEPAVAMDGDGDYVVAWTSNRNNDNDIYAKRFSHSGQVVNDEFRVNTSTQNSQVAADVAMDAEGDFVIAWQGQTATGAPPKYDVYTQRYDKNGDAVAGEDRVNTSIPNNQTRPSVAMDAAGNAVIAWTSDAQQLNSFNIDAQRYAADGSKVDGEFQVNTFNTGSQNQVDVAMDPLGGFMMSWTSAAQDGDAGGIYAQRFLSNGTASGIETRLNTVTAGNQSNSTITNLSPGYYASSWQAGNFIN